jgi:hypothetical protein
MVSKVLHAVFAAAFCVCAVLPVAAAAQESKSAPLAKQLAQALDQAKLESIAAADPTTGAFVAALYIPGTQLLVVSGMFDAPAIGTERISRKEYKDLYMDLQGAAKAGTRVFAQDVSADGLSFKASDGAVDAWEQANKTLAFDGWKKAKMSEEDYTKAYSKADEHYARILTLLIAQAKPKTGT